VSRLAGLGRFVYEFVVGDDWRVAVGVAAAFTATWLLAHHAVAAWWVLPACVAGLLGGSVLQMARSRR
jgi:hypothetical protein